jgi:puromycin-sensitive aminopeptidase
MGAPDDPYRLPRAVTPLRYELHFAPDLDGASFSGRERIELAVADRVEEVVLHASGLAISGACLGPPGALEPAEVEASPEDERLRIRPARSLEPGPAVLDLGFSGSLGDKLTGFYRSRYRDMDGTERRLAATQFEATHAREAFPCFDEPDRKAVFAVSVELDEGLFAVSNAPIVEERPLADGRRLVRFGETIPMSTYLVALVVGPLEATEPREVDGIPVRVVHVPGKGHLARFALDVAEFALRFYADWFGIRYPADKLDLVALPDFAFGAMENLGAVTFRENLLLVDPDSASQAELQAVVDVICHELAHMWFGDLVTMRWWNGIWLNEAFATFMEVLCCDRFRPEWRRLADFAAERSQALRVDGLSSTRPVEYPVGPPEEAEGMFDLLTYQKGAGVVHMLERYLGEERFRAGIRRYLEQHRFANAETTDLWDAIEQAAGEPVRAVMDSFIFQGGHPLVTVRRRGASVELEQRPFRYRAAQGPDAIGTAWQVPLVLRAGTAVGEPVRHRVLLGPEPTAVELGSAPEWVVANDGGSGFYRTRYEPGEAATLVARGVLDPLERVTVVSDTWAAVLAGIAGVEEVLELVALLAPSEDEPAVWGELAAVLTLLERAASVPDRRGLQDFVRVRLGEAFARVGWTPRHGEDPKLPTVRATLLRTLGTVGADPAVRMRAQRLYAEAAAGRATLDADLEAAVATVVATTGGPAEYEAFLERVRRPRTPQEELRYLMALAFFEDAELLERTHALALSEIRSQNAPLLLNRLLAHRVNGPPTWAFVRDHWDELVARFPDSLVVRMLEGLALLVRPDLASEVRGFFEGHDVPQGRRTLEQTLEQLDVNVAFVEREGPRLGAALQGLEERRSDARA